MHFMSSNGSSFNRMLVWKRDDHASSRVFVVIQRMEWSVFGQSLLNSCLNIDVISTFMIESVSNKVPDQLLLLTFSAFLADLQMRPKENKHICSAWTGIVKINHLHSGGFRLEALTHVSPRLFYFWHISDELQSLGPQFKEREGGELSEDLTPLPHSE